VQLDIHFVVMPLVGAFIGALTNDIAIRMLFRPYREVRLWGWRLPFTPGVIPMQRGIIAENIAETFETYLLSGQEIHQFLTGARARHAVEGKVDEMFATLGPFAAFAARLKPRIVAKILAGIEEMAADAIAHQGELDIGERIKEAVRGVAGGAVADVNTAFGLLAKRVFSDAWRSGPDSERTAKIAEILRRATAEIEAL